MTLEKIILEPELDLEEFLRRGGANEIDELRGAASELFAQCARLVRPKALLKEAALELLDDDGVVIAGERFDSRCLSANLRGLDRVHLYLATCGTELERLAAQREGLEGYWVDVIKELALEAVVSETERRVAARLDSAGVAAMNPGSADAEVWPIEQQRQLFRLLGDTRSEVGVELTESLLMIPNKSVSGILFPSRSGWVSCMACTRSGCRGRRAPYEGLFR